MINRYLALLLLLLLAGLVWFLAQVLFGTSAEMPVKPAPEPSVLPPAPDSISQGEHILVVDDDPEAAESVALLLRENGYKVEVAHSAEEAWESVCKLQPILDDVMPGMGGLKLMERVRYSHAHHNIPRIRLGQYIAPSVIGHETQPFDAWLYKPCAPEELLAFVRRILQSSDDNSRYKI